MQEIKKTALPNRTWRSKRRQINDKSDKIPFIVTFPDIQLNFSKLKNVIYKEKRNELLLLGEKACDEFIENNKEICKNLLI